MMPFDAERIQLNARKATTRDLLNRVTVYRKGMEPEALPIIEKELADRGTDAAKIADYREEMEQKKIIFGADGIAICCRSCREPAVAQGWGMHKLFGRIPIFPRFMYWCGEHKPGSPLMPESESERKVDEKQEARPDASREPAIQSQED